MSGLVPPAGTLAALGAAIAIALHGAPVFAQQAPASPAPRVFPKITFNVTRAASGIKVDGVLDEDAWKTAGVVPLPYEWAPGDNVPPPVETECLVTYDAKYLYVAFRAHDPKPGDIRAHLMDRDDTDTLIQDDHVGVMIDTFNDERRAFQFRVNPLGVQADAVFSEQDGVEDFSWDMIWNAVGRITTDGYIVEIGFPLKQLRFQAGEGPQTWGFEAFRSWPRNVRHRISSQARDRNKSCVLCQENKITGLEGLAQGRNVELDPTATFSRTDELASPDAGTLTSGNPDAELGLTGRWSITSSMTLNGTINPDFSQVEADVAQLDVNQRFALFYPEKRPFFLEGIDYFVTPIQSVFTRTVADPYYGAKLTGKQGANAVGVFVTRDSLNNLVFPSNAGSSEASLDEDVSTVVGGTAATSGARPRLARSTPAARARDTTTVRSAQTSSGVRPNRTSSACSTSGPIRSTRRPSQTITASRGRPSPATAPGSTTSTSRRSGWLSAATRPTTRDSGRIRASCPEWTSGRSQGRPNGAGTVARERGSTPSTSACSACARPTTAGT